jgi:membrane peptidoglycan carboxypeptidase
LLLQAPVSHKGEEIGKLFLTRRTVVPLDTLPKYVPAAFIAMEDRRFYDHSGVDWRRVFGALWKNVKSLGIEEGSSTITMQLARNVFPEKLPAHKKTVFRKMAEAKVARSIEKKFTKQEILELYLNQIYFGQGAWGIEAAAQEYYGKPAAKLTLPEAATLAALPRAPSKLNPRTNRDLALEGRKLVLDRMVEEEIAISSRMSWATPSTAKVTSSTLRWMVACSACSRKS